MFRVVQISRTMKRVTNLQFTRRNVMGRILAFLFLTITAVAQQLPREDAVRIAEFYRLAEQIQDRVWPNWSKTPAPLLLVTDKTEFLTRHHKSCGRSLRPSTAVRHSSTGHVPGVRPTRDHSDRAGAKYGCQDQHAMVDHPHARTLSSAPGWAARIFRNCGAVRPERGRYDRNVDAELSIPVRAARGSDIVLEATGSAAQFSSYERP